MLNAYGSHFGRLICRQNDPVPSPTRRVKHIGAYSFTLMCPQSS